jgi:hypothetical protein
MKHGQNNNRRQRSRGNPRRYPNQKGGSFESNGPEAKVRGTAQQILEKYQALARDAYSAGDRILAEGYLQHAEHYYRILNSDNDGQGRDNNRNRQQNANRNDDTDNDDQNTETDAQDNDDEQQDNGLQRTVSRGRNGGSDSASDDGDSNGSEEQPSANEAPDEAPRQRRSRKSEQQPVENTDQSAAD